MSIAKSDHIEVVYLIWQSRLSCISLLLYLSRCSVEVSLDVVIVSRVLWESSSEHNKQKCDFKALLRIQASSPHSSPFANAVFPCFARFAFLP